MSSAGVIDRHWAWPALPASVRASLGVAAIAALFGVLAWGAIVLTRDEERLAAVWVANAVVAVMLLPGNVARAAATLAAVFAVAVAVNLALDFTPMHAAGLALANTLEIGIAVFGMWHFRLARPDMAQFHDLATFCLVAGVVAPLASSVVAVIALDPQTLPAAFAMLWRWTFTDGLGMIIVGPALLIFRETWAHRRRPSMREAIEWTAIVAIGTAITVWVFAFAKIPVAFMVTPVVIAHAFRLGMLGTAVSLVKIATIAMICTWLGRGPIVMVGGTVATKLQLLQAFLAVSFAIGLPIAAALAGRERILAELRESEARFRRLADAAPTAIFRTDAQRRLTYVNPAWSRLTGIPRDEATSARFARLVTEWGAHGIPGEFPRCSPGSVSNHELVLRRADDRVVIARHEIATEHDAAGRFCGMIGIIADLTEERAARDALAEREAQLALLAQNMTDAVLRFSLDGRCLYASPSATELFGSSPAALQSEGLVGRIHPDDASALLDRLCELGRGEIERAMAGFRWRADPGRGCWRWLEANTGLVRDAAGEPAELIACVRDITERRRLEEELAAARSQARRAAA